MKIKANDESKKEKLLIEFIRENQDYFYKVAYTYVKNKENALDIVQESVYKGLKSVGTLKNEEYLKTWFYRILVNTSISFLEKSKKITYVEDISNVPNLRTDNTVDIAEKLDLYDALDKLDSDSKTIIILRYFQDEKIEDISQITSMNINTVKTRLYSSIKKLQLIMEGNL